MTVKEKLQEMMKKGTLHMVLLDPDKQSAEDAAKIAKVCKDAGTDIILIGGSTGITTENVSATAKAIKQATGLLTIHFPTDPQSLSTDVDALLFMSMVNSTDVRLVTGFQAYAALPVKQMGIEPISMGYIICEPGMTVGKVGKADLIKRDDYKKAMAYAAACEMLGMSMVYLEAGSGADKPVAPEMIAAVKKVIKVPLIVGGGIRTPEAAMAARMAGADIIVTGTFVEQCNDSSNIKKVIAAAKGI